MSESVVVLNPFLSTAVSADSASSGAFGRLRVGNPLTLWDSQFQYGKCPDLWDEDTLGAGSVATHLPDESAIEFTVDTGATDYVLRQTRNYLRYKPGKSQLLFLSGTLGIQAGQYRRMGLFDDQNGVFVETDGTTVNMVLRSFTSGGVLETRVPQASWNLNTLDGSSGGITLDMTKAQIFVADLEWLGVGRVRVGLVINGQILYVHQFLHANIIGTTYMTTANLPLRYEARNFAAQGGLTSGFKQICSTLISEGGEGSAAPDTIRAATTDVSTPKTVPDTGVVPAISVRLAPTFNGIVNRGLIEPIGLDILVVASKNIYWELLINPTLTGDTVWASTDSESIAQYNLDATGVSGGRRIAAGFAQGANQSKGFAPFQITPKIRLARNFDNSGSDIAVLAVRSLDNPSSDLFASMQWSEFSC
jgi:hypothetical protein